MGHIIFVQNRLLAVKTASGLFSIENCKRQLTNFNETQIESLQCAIDDIRFNQSRHGS